ncbi:MAG: bacteriocin [Lachnospiraceae bacterium]|nr:bacteriocin [Lachnospiraceae bacterium]
MKDRDRNQKGEEIKRNDENAVTELSVTELSEDELDNVSGGIGGFYPIPNRVL